MSNRPELTIHHVTRVRVVISQPKKDAANRYYRVCKMYVETEEDPGLELTLFSHTDEMSEVYPMVELERPEVDPDEEG